MPISPKLVVTKDAQFAERLMPKPSV